MEKITLNGNTEEVETPMSAIDLLEKFGFEQRFVAIAVNRKCILKKDYKSTLIKAGDDIEVLSPAAGG